MGALIEVEPLLTLSLDEEEGEGGLGEQSRAAGHHREDNFYRAEDTGE